ncbi:MAG: hypothetical protein HQK54_16050 [Oligoflexales bacterium]|nr:hypothetical protein [Oligoflexales bacterium]
MLYRFNLIKIFFTMLTLYAATLSCSEKSAKFSSNESTIGRTIEPASSQTMNMLAQGGKTGFFAFDRYSRRINVIDIETGNLAFSGPIDQATEGDFLVSSKNNQYIMIVSKNKVFIQNIAANTRVQALKLAGSIGAYALDMNAGYYAFVDEYFSVGLMKLDTDGKILSQWTGGPVLEKKFNTVAGEMLPGGQLVLVSKEGELLKIDADKSLQKRSWVFENQPFSFSNPTWVAQVPGRSDRVMVLDSKGLYLIDLSSAATIDKKDLSGISPSTSKNGLCHIHFADLATGYYNLISSKDGDHLDSFYLRDYGYKLSNTYLTDEYLAASVEGRKIVKIRLNDSLVNSVMDMTDGAKVGFNENKVVLMHDSPLGFIEILDLESEEKTIFSSFNLEYLQKNGLDRSGK